MSELAQTDLIERLTAPMDRRTVLFDPTAERHWLDRVCAGRESLRCAPEDWSPAEGWLEAALRSPAMFQASAEWAASRLHIDVLLVSKLAEEYRAVFAARLAEAAGEASGHAARLCADALDWTSGGAPRDPFERWAAFAAIVRGEILPAIILDARTDFRAALEQGDRLAVAGIPIGLRVSPERWRDFLADGNWSRSDTRWRIAHGFGRVGFPVHHEDRQAKGMENFIRSKIPDALPRFEEARDALAADSDGISSPDVARNAAETFLFAVLEARSSTRGRFQLNVPLDFSFGARDAKGDLADVDSRVVIEIDGYHDFREPDSYRRDRRKDSLLQEHGWFVIRFLADDVVRDIDKVLYEIEYILARRDAVRAVLLSGNG